MFASSVDEFMSADCRGERSDELTKYVRRISRPIIFHVDEARAVDAASET